MRGAGCLRGDAIVSAIGTVELGDGYAGFQVKAVGGEIGVEGGGSERRAGIEDGEVERWDSMG